MFPLKNYKYEVPTRGAGSFEARRKHDIHTGVDLYCENGDDVFAIEDGVVVAIENFTGESAGSPWWNETKSVLVEGESGVILYGEINPYVELGDVLKEGSFIGKVKQVLKKDKGVNPTSMLHMELYEHGTRESIWWKLDEEQPSNLLDITQILLKERNFTITLTFNFKNDFDCVSAKYGHTGGKESVIKTARWVVGCAMSAIEKSYAEGSPRHIEMSQLYADLMKQLEDQLDEDGKDILNT